MKAEDMLLTGALIAVASLLFPESKPRFPVRIFWKFRKAIYSQLPIRAFHWESRNINVKLLEIQRLQFADCIVRFARHHNIFDVIAKRRFVDFAATCNGDESVRIGRFNVWFHTSKHTTTAEAA